MTASFPESKMNLRTLLLGLLMWLSACRCSGPSLGPLEDPKPATLGETGLLVEQPRDGETVDSQWVTVTGWVDRSRYAYVAVVGAPTTSFYATTGHMGVPTVPVLVRDDGRFVAARVPLEKGATQLLIIALTGEGKAGAQADRTVNSNAVPTPATIVVNPAEGGRAPLTVSFEPHAAKKVTNWQWDYDGDGHFDEEMPIGRHKYTEPGSYLVFARTRLDDRWLWTVAPVQVMGDDDITHSTAAVTSPRAVVVVPKKTDPLMQYEQAEALEAVDPMSFTQSVLVADGDVIKVFDPQLNLLRTLTGFKAPEGAAQDDLNRTFVADTGNNRVVCVGADGALDPSFADGGVLAEVNGQPLRSPTTVLLRNHWAELDGGLFVELDVATADGIMSCTKLDDCHPADGTKARRLVRTISAFAEHPDTWLVVDGKLLRESDRKERAGADDVLDAARGLRTNNPWWVVLRADGRLEERFSTVSNVRVTRLGFPATALALDGNADYLLTKRIEGEDGPNSRITGPHVIYIAGPGRLERRVLPQMGEGLW